MKMKTLPGNLPGVLVQEYSSTYEVIVVNDNSVDDSKYILQELKKTFKIIACGGTDTGSKTDPWKKISLSR